MTEMRTDVLQFRDGKIIDGDLILYIGGCYMKGKTEAFQIILLLRQLCQISGLYKALDKAGINYEKTTVRDKYVYEKYAAEWPYLGGQSEFFRSICNNRWRNPTSIKMMK